MNEPQLAVPVRRVFSPMASTSVVVRSTSSESTPLGGEQSGWFAAAGGGEVGEQGEVFAAQGFQETGRRARP